MALHPWSEGWVNGGRNEGCRDRTRSSAQRSRVSVACELRPRAAGFNNTGAYASRLRNILCGRWEIGSTDTAGRDERRGWALNERTSGRNDDGSSQQWDVRIESAHNVRRRRDQAVLGAGQVPEGKRLDCDSARAIRLPCTCIWHLAGPDYRVQLVDKHAHVLAVVDRRHNEMNAAVSESSFEHRREFRDVADARALGAV